MVLQAADKQGAFDLSASGEAHVAVPVARLYAI